MFLSMIGNININDVFGSYSFVVKLTCLTFLLCYLGLWDLQFDKFICQHFSFYSILENKIWGNVGRMSVSFLIGKRE